MFEDFADFNKGTKIKQLALTYLAWQLPEKELEDLREIFIHVDKNGDGRVTAEEFNKAMQNTTTSYSEEKIKEIISTIDTNNNGWIDYNEFLAGGMRSKVYLN